MKRVLYGKVIVPANESQDGETPSAVYVTREVNGSAVHFDSFETGQRLLRWFYEGREFEAIEFAVLWSRRAIGAVQQGLPLPPPIRTLTGGEGGQDCEG